MELLYYKYLCCYYCLALSMITLLESNELSDMLKFNLLD
jgi:hypothetical protein